MNLQQYIKTSLEKIRAIKGVENVVLTQRDGNPLQSAGVWLSKNEIFNLSSATSAIYNLGLHLHSNQLKYILIEGKSAKIFIAPLKNSLNDPIDRIMISQGIKNKNEEFFIAITATPNVNLGGVFLNTREGLRDIKRSLILSGESFKPPLRKFGQAQLDSLLSSFNVKETEEKSQFLSLNSISFSEKTIQKIDHVLNRMNKSILNLKSATVTTSGGFLVSSLASTKAINDTIEHKAAMTYSLFSTANRCAWLLKKMKIENILLECFDYFQFITEMDDGIFSVTIDKGKQKLGLLRLLIPRFAKLLKKNIKEAKRISDPMKSINLDGVLGQICLREG